MLSEHWKNGCGMYGCRVYVSERVNRIFDSVVDYIRK